jgi:hypothetical protein
MKPALLRATGAGNDLSDPRYSQWYARHERRMRRVGMLVRRESQILELRRT